MNQKIGFEVSARTARLIGREGIASAEGAIIELVKNSYDADANKCLVFIDNKYPEVPSEISQSELKKIIIDNPTHRELLSSSYQSCLLPGVLRLDERVKVDDLASLEEIFFSYNAVFIADNGHGMTADIIKGNWMTIGASDKESNQFSANGRVHTGSKGVGRFSLDRLGHKCELFTKNKGGAYCHWSVDWDDFEKLSKLSEVSATLNESSFKFSDVLSSIPVKSDFISNTGTVLIVSGLRDVWRKSEVSKLYENLKTLMPPLEEANFELTVINTAYPDLGGVLTYLDYEDYDWKVEAIFKDGYATLKFFPMEFNLKAFDKSFFEHKLYKKEKLFSPEEFYNGFYEKRFEIKDFVRSSNNAEVLAQEVEKVGDFSFSIYYAKHSQSSKDQAKYFYKDIKPAIRKKWFAKNGGVKIYRDKLRVRPYGLGSNFDWLKLDERAASSPAAPKRKGQWRVRSHQLTGVANISCVTNQHIKDQTNREGLIDNHSLSVFKQMLLTVIWEFEYHRSFIASILNIIHGDRDESAQVEEQAKEIASKYEKGELDLELTAEETVQTLLRQKEFKDEQIEQLNDQIKMLRVLASSGAMIASFAHDFQNISDALVSRYVLLQKVLKKLDLDLTQIHKDLDPFRMIRDMKSQDEKLSSWLKLTLNTLKKDRRKSKNISIVNYLNSLGLFWKNHLEERNIAFEISAEANPILKCFEIELDCIFNNLITNSMEAFSRKGFRGSKAIRVNVIEEDKTIKFLYSDNGPGLVTSIKYSEQIFIPLYTTKTDPQGEDTGTGLGMSIVHDTVQDLKGDIEVLSQPGNLGFEISISIPK